MQKLIICDFDKTLYFPDQARSFERVLKLVAALPQGCAFAVASGRAPSSLKRHLSSVEDKIYTVSCDGALITKNGEILYENAVDKNALDAAFAACGGISDVGGAAGGCDAVAACGELVTYIKYSEENVGRALFKQFHGHVMTVSAADEIEESIYKIFFLGGKKDGKMPQTDIFSRLKQSKNAVKPGYCKNEISEFISASASKGAAARFLMKTLKIAPENVYAFGDGENDLSLFEAAGNSFASVYAAPAVKKCAETVFGDIEYEITKIINKG